MERFNWCNREFNFSNGKIARLADGSVLVRAGGTAVLVTAVSEGVIDESFFGAPLKVSIYQLDDKHVIY